MTEISIKFYNTENIHFEEQSKASQVVKNDFQNYLIKNDPHHIDILENKNQILCTIICDKADFQYNQNEKKLQIFYKDKKDKEPQLALEIQSYSQSILKEIIENISERKIYTKYKGPLSYVPSRLQRTSLLSSESPEQNYRGFMNAAGLVLFINNIRQIVQNLKEYGLQLNNIYKQPWDYIDKHFAFMILIQFFFIGVTFLIQKAVFSSNIGPQFVKIKKIKHFYKNLMQARFLNIINLSLQFLSPVIYKKYFEIHFIPSVFLIGFNIVVFLKLISYSHVMRDIFFLIKRVQKYEKQSNKKNVSLSDVITEAESSSDNLELIRKNCNKLENIVELKNLIFFFAAPTLCFQLIYPRTQAIRKLWLLKRCIELILIIALQTQYIFQKINKQNKKRILWFQYLHPALQETYELSKDPNNITFLFILERMLKLSIPNLYFWISGFYGMFQLFQIQLLNQQDTVIDNSIQIGGIVEIQNNTGDNGIYLFIIGAQDIFIILYLKGEQVNYLLIYQFSLFPLYCMSGLLALLWVLQDIMHFQECAYKHLLFTYKKIQLKQFFCYIIYLVYYIFFKILRLENSQLGNLMFWISFCFIGQPLSAVIYYNIYRNVYG
ncbi:hypothetical protein IMG5_133280 [Ichthyophthirius multifiliis]|uniref:O-acyltransferase n=1 Tax=Ichthyophthirius multifiliis TaxID=5932 RepID=G0QWL6_ICHMU|nr:hypothetical protein IMG5_133280 [Ichthyophthirius multifiliis]EGR30391.1 hypothetical protein IMG5_133280 [Ichthyophthirius multifiliis]|eukprot:XP_004031978.1 hypothetical protein IMG5_133280 [Ichthyophthirius multifiliis]